MLNLILSRVKTKRGSFMPENKSRKNNLILKRVSLTLFFCLISTLAFAQTELAVSSVSASSAFKFYAPSNTIDNNLSTYWQTQSKKAQPSWIQYQFSAIANIDSITIWWDSSQYATNYKIQLSNDGGNWTDTLTNLNAQGATKSYTLTGNTASYLRIYINTVNLDYPQIYEVKIYGTQGQADTQPPTVSITNPLNGQTVSSTVNITANAQDNVAVSKVEFYIDNVLKSTDTNSPYFYNWDTTLYANGNHTIKAIAYDASNNNSSDTITVNVENVVLPKIPSSVTVSDENSSYPATNTIDSNYSTFWSSNRKSAYPITLTYDFSKTYSLESINIWWNNANYATNYDIKISEDGISWTNLYTGFSESGSSTNPYRRAFSLSGQARYLRIQINSINKFFARISEVEVYGSGIDIDTTPPTGTIKINNDAQYTNSTSVTLNLSATDSGSGMGTGSQMQFSNDGTNWSIPEAYASTKSWTLTTGDGTKTVYVKYKDVAGNWSQAYSDTILLDSTVPITTSSGIDGLWHTGDVTVTLTASDSGSGINKIYYSTDGTNPTIIYITPFTLSSDGTYTIKYYSTDKAGNSESIKTAANQVKIDKTPPAGTIKINNDAQYTNSTAVTLTLSATESGSGLSQMQLSNDGTTWSTPEAYATTKSWVLTSGEGTKTVYVKFKDIAGSWSNAYSDTIILNIQPQGSFLAEYYNNPIGTASPAFPAGDPTLTRYDAVINFDWGSGSPDPLITADNFMARWTKTEYFTQGDYNFIATVDDGVRLWIDSTFIIDKWFDQAAKTYTSKISVSEGNHTVKMEYYEHGGNAVAKLSYQLEQADTTAPTGTIKINNDAQYTNSTSVTLNLSATDSSSGMGTGSQMQFSNDGTNWSTPEAYATTKAWTIVSGDGTKTVYVKFKDVAGNWSQAYSDTIILDTIAPQITNTTPLDKATFYITDTITVTCIVNDIDASLLEYQFLIDGAIKQPWSSASSYSWIASSQDKGSHNIRIEARDAGGQDSKQVEVYIFRKPIEPPH
jgi:hypothetical protein